MVIAMGLRLVGIGVVLLLAAVLFAFSLPGLIAGVLGMGTILAGLFVAIRKRLRVHS